MTNLAISQMPVETPPLAGTELLECVQGGVNVQSTVAALAGTVTPFSTIGNPNGVIGAGLQNQLSWFTATPIVPGGGFLQGDSNITITSQQWQRNFDGASSAQSFTGLGANLAASVQGSFFSTGAVANSKAEMYPAALWGGVQSNPAALPMIRAASNGLPIAGFTMVAYFVFSTVIATEQVFFGYSSAAGGIPGLQIPGNLVNAIGLSRDTTDVNLQFLISNASGGKTKTSLGVTLASLANQLLRLVITCDGLGNCAITLSNLEAGGLTYSANFVASTANLPAASTGPGVNWLIPRFYINNGGTAANCAYMINQAFFTAGFGS